MNTLTLNPEQYLPNLTPDERELFNTFHSFTNSKDFISHMDICNNSENSRKQLYNLSKYLIFPILLNIPQDQQCPTLDHLYSIFGDIRGDVMAFTDDPLGQGDGHTAFSVALELSCTEIWDRLLDHGADIHHGCGYRWRYCPVGYAATFLSLDHVKYLISKGANVNMWFSVTDQYSPIQSAYRNENQDTFEYLMSLDGLDLTRTNLLDSACGNGDFKLIDRLLKRSDVDVNRGRSLYSAIEHDQDEVVQFLLKYPGIDVNDHKVNLGPLDIAIYKGREDIIEQLLAKGAIYTKTNQDSAFEKGINLLHIKMKWCTPFQCNLFRNNGFHDVKF